MWATANPDSPAYHSLVTNSSKATTHLEPLPLPANTPSFVPRAHAERYLQQFASHCQLLDSIHFLTCVEEVKRSAAGDGSWAVTLRHVDTGRVTVNTYRAVVVATGTQSRSTAHLPAELYQQAVAAGIPAIHSCDYREPFSYADKSLLVVGLGNSASEIATEVSRVTKRTLVAVRSTPWIVPLSVLGVPADGLGSTPLGPHWLQMLAFTCLQRLYIGHPTSLGFPQPPDHQLLDRLPVSDRGITQALRSGRVQLRRSVRHIGPAGVTFDGAADAEAEKVDAVIFATGYKHHYPFLPLGSRTGDEMPEPLLTLFHPTEAGLMYMEEFSVPQSSWPGFTQQAEAIVQYLLADAERSKRCVELHSRRRVQHASPDYKGHLFSAADRWHADPVLYQRMLTDFAQWIAAKDC